jgi:hypothetical protein
MSSPLAINAVRFTPATATDVATGLLGYVACVVDDRLYLDGITLRRTAAGKLALSFPAHRDRRGDDHPYMRPVNDIARQDIERVIFQAIARQVTA